MNTISLFSRNAALLLVSAGLVTLLFAWEGAVGFGLADESFLWYGAQRVIAGEWPIRDFMAYDPGRYLLSAALLATTGDSGILALRAVTAAVGALGLYLALRLLTAGPARLNRVALALAAVALAAWLLPRHKLFDITTSIALVVAVAYVLDRPASRRWCVLGLTVGLAAVIGRNHGVYGVVASLLALLLAGVAARGRPQPAAGATPPAQALLCWAAGVVTGYLPVLLMLVVVPGYAAAFWDTVLFQFELGATNLPLPVPWPWLSPYTGASAADRLAAMLPGLWFIGVLAFIGIGFAVVLRRALCSADLPSPILTASVLVALPYAHFAFSRADIAHLAQGIFPVLIGVCWLLTTRPGARATLLAGSLCLVSLVVAGNQHPGWQAIRDGRWVEFRVGDDELTVPPRTAAFLELLKGLVQRYAPDGKPFLAIPNWPGAYAALGRKSPLWEIYALLPRSEAFQRAEIERIRQTGPAFVLVEDQALDGRDVLRYRNTHPLVMEFIESHFERQEKLSSDPNITLYLPR